MSITYSAEGIVLKRINYSDADRIVTIYTKNLGKITAIAKGARKTVSKKKGGLEPATQTVCYFAKGKGMPIITQTNIIKSFSNGDPNLVRITQILQILEIVDVITVEEEPNQTIYQLLIESLSQINKNGSKKDQLLENIRAILKTSGFGPPENYSEYELKDYIEEITNRDLKTKKFLTTTKA